MAFNPASALMGEKAGQMANPWNILSGSIQRGSNTGNALMHLLYAPQAYQDAHNMALARIAALNKPKSPQMDSLDALYAAQQNETDPIKKRMLQMEIEKAVSGSKGQSISASPSGVTINQGGQGVSDLFQSAQPQQMPQSATLKTPSRGTEMTYTKNPDGTYSVQTTPTTKTQSNIQQRQLGASESEVLRPQIAAWTNAYTGPGGYIKMFADRFGVNGKKGQERFSKFLAGHSLLNEYAANQLRQSGSSQIGEGNMQSTIQQSFPGLPPEMLINLLASPQSQMLASQLSGQLLGKGVTTAAQRNAAGYQTQLPQQMAPSNIRQVLGDNQNNNYLGYTPSEIEDYAKRSGLTVQEVKKRLLAALGGQQ